MALRSFSQTGAMRIADAARATTSPHAGPDPDDGTAPPETGDEPVTTMLQLKSPPAVISAGGFDHFDPWHGVEVERAGPESHSSSAAAKSGVTTERDGDVLTGLRYGIMISLGMWAVLILGVRALF